MFIFVFLNLICLSIILAKFIWHSENSRRETARYVDGLFGIPKRELELIAEEQDAEELNHTCENCINGCDDDEEDEDEDEDEDEEDEDNKDDNSTHDSMPDLVEADKKEAEAEPEDKEDESERAEESDDVSIEHVSAADLDVIKDTLGFIQKTKEMLIEIKSDLEKKID